MATEIQPVRTFLVLLGLAILAALLVSAVTGNDNKSGGTSLGNSIAAVMPSGALPNGTVSGDCGQESVPNPSQAHAADLHGDADVKNTGNIGITVTVTMTWPQLGSTPITMTKNGVRVDHGQTVPVPFDRPVDQNQLTNFKDWQDQQNEQGCTYTGAMINTFGDVH
jgi:hypothetical protein